MQKAVGAIVDPPTRPQMVIFESTQKCTLAIWQVIQSGSDREQSSLEVIVVFQVVPITEF
jgi:hypothetical protein